MNDNVLKKLITKVVNQVDHIRAINLSTADGFTLYASTDEAFDLEKDKLSAVSSSLLSLSNAACRQLIESQLVNTIIESEAGNIIILKTQYQNKSCALCVITGVELTLGKARYYAIKLAESITAIPVKN